MHEHAAHEPLFVNWVKPSVLAPWNADEHGVFIAATMSSLGPFHPGGGVGTHCASAPQPDDDPDEELDVPDASPTPSEGSAHETIVTANATAKARRPRIALRSSPRLNAPANRL